MHRRSIFTLALGLALLPGLAAAQQKSPKEQLVGTWLLASYDSVAADGARSPIFGAQPKGILIIDAGGHYAMVFNDPGRAKWKSNLRTQVSNDEFAAAAKGLVAQFGTWSVDDAGKVMTRNVEGSLSPNLPGNSQTPAMSLSGDELTFIDVNSGVTGTKTTTVFKRVK